MKLLPLVASLILVWIAFQKGRLGVSVPLFGGGSTANHLTFCGMNVFGIYNILSETDWDFGFANNNPYTN